MRLLIITQRVDATDPTLGFFVRWIEEFAKHCEMLTVICLERGAYALPQNVEVISLGKEKARVPASVYALRFLRLIWKVRHDYDSVLVHMNPEYVVLGGPLWKLLRKGVALWYTHRSNRLLSLALPFVDKVFSASKESFPFESPKLHVLGHGIDTEHFKPMSSSRSGAQLRLLSIGRISPTKRHHLFIEALGILHKAGFSASLDIVGAPVTEADRMYELALRDEASRSGLASSVEFLGPKPYTLVPQIYADHDLLLHASVTGSIDKVVVEAMSCGLPVLSTSPAFKGLLPEEYLLKTDTPADIAGTIRAHANVGRNAEIRERVIRSHNLATTIEKIIANLK